MEMSFSPPSYEATMSATMTVNPSFDDTSTVVDGAPSYDDDLPPAYDSIYDQQLNSSDNTGNDNTEAPSINFINPNPNEIHNETEDIVEQAQNESEIQNFAQETSPPSPQSPPTSQEPQSGDSSNDPSVSTVLSY